MDEPSPTRLRLLAAACLVCTATCSAPHENPSQTSPAADPPEVRLTHARVTFLAGAQARSALTESGDGFFENMRALELEAFVGRPLSSMPSDELSRLAREQFGKAVREFSAPERAALIELTQRVDERLRSAAPRLVDYPWSFIKVDRALCGGSAFTRGPHIVLSERHLDRLRLAWSGNDERARQRAMQLLVHEKLHVVQRAEPNGWSELFAHWGFRHALEIESDEVIERRRVDNPDSVDLNWVFEWVDAKGEVRVIWPRTLIADPKTEDQPAKHGLSFEAAALDLEPLGGGRYRLLRDEQGVPMSRPLAEHDAYRSRLPEAQLWDHPNEVAAYTLSELLMGDPASHRQPTIESRWLGRVFADSRRSPRLELPPDPPRKIRVQPIQVARDDGSMPANADRRLFEEVMDQVWSQAGVDVEFLPWRRWNSTRAWDAPMLSGNIDWAAEHAPLHPDPEVANLLFVNTINGPQKVGGLSETPGRVMFIADWALDATLHVLPHELGHNLGLNHATLGAEADTKNLMSAELPGGFRNIHPQGRGYLHLTPEQIQTSLASPLVAGSSTTP